MFRQYFYHLTQSPYLIRRFNHSKICTLYPKDNGDNRPCLIALGTGLLNEDDDILILRTKNKITGTKTYDVIDALVTQERWICRPSYFINIGKIKIQQNQKICEYLPTTTGSEVCISEQKMALNKISYGDVKKATILSIPEHVIRYI